MRGTFAKTLAMLGAEHPEILLLTGDLGYMALEPFSDSLPDRFVNVGVAEQNMVGLATGLADAGFVPFAYSIVTFATLRAFEFVRNGPIHQHLPVRIVGVGGGFEYGSAGPTHHGLEDVSVFRTQPGMRVVVPADFEQARAALEQTWNLPGPTYYRLGKDDRTVVPGLGGRFELGRAVTVGAGGDVLLVAMGAIAADAVRAMEMLEARGIAATTLIVSSFNPAPDADLLEALRRRFRVVLSVEAHYVNGALGSLVAETIAQEALPVRLLRCGVRTPPGGRSGSQGYYHALHGLTPEALASAAETAWRASP